MNDQKTSELNPTPALPSIDDAQIQSFNYQLDFLKMEYQAINEMIKRIDEMTQKNKDWAVLLWAGSISGAISRAELRQYVVLTAILPLLFWFLDAWWRSIQRTGIFRVEKISDFLNGDKLIESFRQRKLTGFQLVDPRSKQYRKLPEFKNHTKISKTIWFKEVCVFYLGLIAFSIILGTFFLLVPQK